MNAKHPQLHIECKFYKIMQGGGKKIQNSTQFKNYFDMINLGSPLDYVQSLEYETGKTVLFWDILWHKNFVCMNCETNLDSECAPKPPWPTGFEKSKLHQPNPEKLQFKGSKIPPFLLVFQHFPLKSSKIVWILENRNFSGLGWGILDFSKPVGQGGFGAHSEAKLVSQFLPTKFLCHKMSQNNTVFSISYSRDFMSNLEQIVFWDPLERLNKIYINLLGQTKKI